MSQVLSIALVGDGPTDEALWPVIGWTLRDRFGGRLRWRRAGFSHRGGRSAEALFEEARARFGADLVILHRDAEGQDPELRRVELPEAPELVPLIPVRMTEAWLLIDAAAIGMAADNPAFDGLVLPPLRRLEALPNPKGALDDLLWQAADLGGARRRKRFQRDLGHRRVAVADYIEDYAPLRELSAFQRFEGELTAWVDGWLARP